MAVVQLLCMTGAYETICSVRVAINRQCHISSTKFPGGIQARHTADEDAIISQVQHMLNK